MPEKQDFIASVKTAIKAQVPQATFPGGEGAVELPNPPPAGTTRWMQSCTDNEAHKATLLAHNLRQATLHHNSTHVSATVEHVVDPATGANCYMLDAWLW